MSIIRGLQNFIERCNGLEIILIGDKTENVNNHAIYPTGNINTKVDVCGNKTYVRNYIFLARRDISEQAQMQGYDFLEDFCDLVEYANDNHTFPSLGGNITVLSMDVSDITLMDIADGWDKGTYKVQLNLSYIKGE